MRPKIVSWSENDSSSREACLLGGICVSEPLVNQVKSMTSLTRQQKRRLLNDVKEDARKHFENERNAVLESLPYSVKNHFFAVGYAKYENTHLPALVVDPFCVGPGSVRKSWLRRFKMVRLTHCDNSCLRMRPHTHIYTSINYYVFGNSARQRVRWTKWSIWSFGTARG